MNTRSSNHSEELPSTAEAKESSPPTRGVEETKKTPPPNEQTTPSAAQHPDLSFQAMKARMTRIVDHQLQRMEDGEIDQLSDQHNNMLQQLASLNFGSSGVPVNLSGDNSSTSVPGPTYAGVLSAPKTVTVTPNDVRSLPRMTGDVDVDVAEVITQFRLVVGFRAKSVAPNDEQFADNLAFEHLCLICDGPCLTLYQQLMSGRIDWSANVVNAENVNNPGSFPPPSTWEELKLAILDILMPANSVEECAIKLATFKPEKGETVSASALRFRALMSRFESAVERHAKGRTPWSAITVTLWQHSLPPALQLMQSGEKPVTSFKEAVERARRHEAARLTGTVNVSALSFTPVPNRAAAHQFTSSRQQRPNSNQRGRSNGGGARSSGGRQRSKQQPAQQERKPRPLCTYSGCQKPVGHWESTCFQKERDNGLRPQQSTGGPKRDRSSSPRGNGNRRHRGRRNDDNDDRSNSGNEND